MRRDDPYSLDLTEPGEHRRDSLDSAWDRLFRLRAIEASVCDQCFSNATPQQTNTAANHRRRSTFSCSTHFAATALLTKVSDPAAGAIRLTSAWLRENNNEKKLRAIKATPPRNRPSLTTAQM